MTDFTERLVEVRKAISETRFGDSDPLAAISVNAGRAMILTLANELLAASGDIRGELEIETAVPLAFAFAFNAVLYCGNRTPEAAQKLFASVQETTERLGNGDPGRLSIRMPPSVH
jgi:hypothetical protein